MSVPESTMREDLEAAIVTLGDDSGMEPAPVVEPISPEPIKEVIDAEGKTAETKAEAEATAGKVSEGAEADTGGESKIGTADSAGEFPAIDKAPESWQPEAREGWKELPEPIRQQIHKRETEINTALMDGSDNRKRGEQFSDIAGRYAQVIAAEGVTDPLVGFEEMMKVMSVLRMGTAEQKAQKIADFIGGYGISVEMLDGILTAAPAIGGGNGAAAIGDPTMAYINQQMKPVNDLLTRMNAQDQQQNFTKNQAYMAEVVKFKGENEFYADVQDDMADLCEMASKRGYDMPLAEAYSKACVMNPSVSKVMAERTETARLAEGGKIMTSKREASSSLMSGQQEGIAATEDLDLRGTLNAAWDAQSG